MNFRTKLENGTLLTLWRRGPWSEDGPGDTELFIVNNSTLVDPARMLFEKRFTDREEALAYFDLFVEESNREVEGFDTIHEAIEELDTAIEHLARAGRKLCDYPNDSPIYKLLQELVPTHETTVATIAILTMKLHEVSRGLWNAVSDEGEE